MISTERLAIVPKALKDRKKGKWQCGGKIKVVIKFHLIKGIGDKFAVIVIVVSLCQQVHRLSCRAHSKKSAITTAGCISS